jgi:hypothetical protein
VNRKSCPEKYNPCCRPSKPESSLVGDALGTILGAIVVIPLLLVLMLIFIKLVLIVVVILVGTMIFATCFGDKESEEKKSETNGRRGL